MNTQDMLQDLEQSLTGLGDKFGDYVGQALRDESSLLGQSKSDLDAQLTDLADAFGDYIDSSVTDKTVHIDFD